MLHYLKHYPVSLTIIAIICYLSFFTPPETKAEEIPYIDKIVHLCMYGGLCLIIWIEYLRQHPAIHTKRMLVGGILAPALMSGCIELLQEYGTSNRSGDWADLLANLIGVVSAALVGRYLLWPYFHQKRERRYADDSHEQPTQ